MIAHKVKGGISRIDNIKNIIAITSGKGGVGKSTVAANIAIMLARDYEFKIGILDADIYGPSIPTMLGARDFKPEVVNSKFTPLEKSDIQIMSFGFLINESQPAIWRGPIVNKALEQMLYDSTWHSLDCLIIDMPPGTGDIHLTMCQKMPITAIISVTTPQDVSLLDVAKSIHMYNKLQIPVLGIVENMSTYTCKNCGHCEELFGAGAGIKLATQFQIPLLAQLPYEPTMHQACDSGILEYHFTHDNIFNEYRTCCDNLLQQLDKIPKYYHTGTLKVT